MKLQEKIADFLLDTAKLIFGGIILSGIMAENINRWVVYGLGIFVWIFTFILGLVLYNNTKRKES